MTEDPWLSNEAQRIIDDLNELTTDINLIERRYQVEMSDKDQTVVLGKNEWSLFKSRITDACDDMAVALNDFLENDYRQQLHWSGLRLLTASGVLTAELRAYREKLAYIGRHPSNNSLDVHKLFNWFTARVEPMSGRLSARMVQFISRVLAPSSWGVTSELGDLGSQSPSSMSLSLEFEPLNHDASKSERDRVKRLKRLEVN